MGPHGVSSLWTTTLSSITKMSNMFGCTDLFFANSCLGCCQLYSCSQFINQEPSITPLLLKGFCFKPLNLNLFSNSSFYLKGSSSYLHIYNSLQPTSCPDKLINRTYYTYNLASNSMSTGILLDHEIGTYLYFHHCTVTSRSATSNLFLLTC